jgi:hypothetical protein
MNTTTQEAADIRAQYKALGWSSRDIGVRAEYFSMGSSIYITLKSASVDPHRAKAIAEGKERISRDAYTGEILGGGNRYVHMNYSDEYREILSRRFYDAVSAADTELSKAGDGVLIPIAGTEGRAMLGKAQWGGSLELWFDDRHAQQYNAGSLDAVAFELALRMMTKADT